MMNKFILFLSGTFLVTTIRAQKPLLTPGLYKDWPVVADPGLSPDGKYAHYAIQTKNEKQLIILSVDGKWQRQFAVANGYFGVQWSRDMRYLIFRKAEDSVAILVPGNDTPNYITQITDIQCLGNKFEWILYQQKNKPGVLTLNNLLTGAHRELPAVKTFHISPDAKILALEKENHSLVYYDIAGNKESEIWKGDCTGNIVWSNEGSMVFVAHQNDRITGYWYYCPALQYSKEVLKDTLLGGLELGLPQRFTKDGKRLFFYLRAPSDQRKKVLNVDVTVWSYQDKMLQSEQKKKAAGISEYKAVLDIAAKKVIRLEQPGEDLSWDICLNDDFGILRKNSAGMGETIWNNGYEMIPELVSTIDGSRTKLPHIYAHPSPAANYFVYYDALKNNFFSYERASGIIRNVTKKANTSWINSDDDGIWGRASTRGVAGWINEETLLIYDAYDIWKLSANGKFDPVNITGGEGRRARIVFNIALPEKYNGLGYINIKQDLLLTAFNPETKDNGFYNINIYRGKLPEMLTMGPFVYYAPSSGSLASLSSMEPIKAAKAKVYLVVRSDAETSPNYFITKDFKTLKQISYVNPEKSVNWLTSSLHTWKTTDGRKMQGVLYKPKNFNPSKKYPLIINYYDRLSDRLNAYLVPSHSGNNINIPTYVSNGYLLFTADIWFETGNIGESAYKCIESAAAYLSTLSYVDSTRMGIEGISFGGYSTNYIVTHSKRFAAACSQSSVSDVVSSYNRLRAKEHSNQGYYETGQGRMFYTLWEKPELYIKNSPVFSADKVVTPLLLFHTTIDDAVDFDQALEMFIAMRRLGKKVWLLEYKDGNHAVHGEAAIDFSIRQLQFFDHYLKEKPPARWMTQGILQQDKGYATGLETDVDIKTPGAGPFDETYRNYLIKMLNKN